MMLEEESNDLGFTSKMTFPISAWMEKEGHIMKSWNRRFFVLDGTTKTVIYYSDSAKNDKKGEIVLNRHAVCSIEPDRPDHKFLMNVAGSKRGSFTTTLLSFESEKSRKTWYDAIMEISQGIDVRVADIIPDSFRLELPMRITYSSNPAKNGVTSPSRRASLNPVAIVSNGNSIPPSVTVSEPSISYSSNESTFHHEFYTLIMADPDMPSRENPAMREFIHWMVCNIPGNDVLKGTTVIPYLGPSPVLNSGVHRIFFLLFRQAKKFTQDEMSELMAYQFRTNNSQQGTSEKDFDKATLQLFVEKREKIRIWKWADKLGNPISVEGFSSEWDESCNTNLTDLFFGGMANPTSLSGRETSADLHKGISEGCCGCEKMFIKYRTFHTIPCPLTACCSDLQLDEQSDNDTAHDLSKKAEKSLLMRCSNYHTIDCCDFVPEDMIAVREQERRAQHSMCNQFMEGSAVACCGLFDYRDFIFDSWDEFSAKCQNLFDRFMGHRIIGCCSVLEDEYRADGSLLVFDGPAQRVTARKTFDTYSKIHLKRGFSRIKEFHTIGCCTQIPEDDPKMGKTPLSVCERSAAIQRNRADEGPFARFLNYEVVHLIHNPTKEEQERIVLEAAEHAGNVKYSNCQRLIDGHEVNLCEFCLHFKHKDQI